MQRMSLAKKREQTSDKKIAIKLKHKRKFIAVPQISFEVTNAVHLKALDHKVIRYAGKW